MSRVARKTTRQESVKGGRRGEDSEAREVERSKRARIQARLVRVGQGIPFLFSICVVSALAIWLAVYVTKRPSADEM